MFAIAKPASGDTRFFVTAILQGGLKIDNLRVDLGNEWRHEWRFRKFRSLASAEAARAKLLAVGGFDDYHVVEL